MTLQDVIEIYLNRKVDFSYDVKIFLNDNNEPYIKEWNVLESQPSQEYINTLLPKCKHNINIDCKCNAEYASCKERENKIAELRDKCNETILAGFYSKALGGVEEKFYTYSQDDQINIAGRALEIAMGLNTTGYVKFKHTGLPEFIDYTIAEFMQIGRDSGAHKGNNISKYHAKKAYINNNNLTKEQLQAINWDSIE